MDVLVRLLRGSGDVQTAQSQPIMGTPCDVPLPSTITSMAWQTRLGRSAPKAPTKKAPRPSGWSALEFLCVGLGSVVHAAAARGMRGSRILLLGHLGDHALGREQEACDRCRVLQRRAGH